MSSDQRKGQRKGFSRHSSKGSECRQRDICVKQLLITTQGILKKVQKARARGNQKAVKVEGYTKRDRGENLMTVKDLQF